jgi:predicted DNA-binding protein
MHTIQFDAQSEQELTRLAILAGKDADQLIKDVVGEFLEEQEDSADAQAMLAKVERGEEKTVSWKAIKAEHGL